jgi:hypothetical protein
MIEIGKWNHLETALGQRGMGKSTHQCVRAMELQIDAGGAYVIGHSIGGRLPTRLPAEYGGHVLPITYHETIDALARGLRRHPERWHILAPSISTDGRAPRETADDLIKFVIAFSRKVRKRAWEKKYPFGMEGARFGWRDNVSHEGVLAPPIILIIDEGIAIEAAGVSRKEDNRWFLQFLYSLRHYHIALLYAIQDASARSWRILEQATILWIFAIRHRWALQSIEAAGASEDDVNRIRHLREYEFVMLDLTEPIGDTVLDADDVPPHIRRTPPNPARIEELRRIEAQTPDGTPA